MNLASSRLVTRVARRAAVAVVVLAVWAAPAMAQNKKNSWEVFLYFGSFYANNIPSAKQFGDIRTYRTDPLETQLAGDDPNILSNVFTPNLGNVGGGSTDPNYPFFTLPGDQFGQAPCNNNGLHLDPNDQRAPYFDECDADQESRYLYNASRITTNGEIQRDDREFTLGLRAGYNITRHWEVEFDIGFGKQRLDLTKNLDPLLQLSINDIADPRARALADFYQFTWSNVDYQSIVYLPSTGLIGEHPNVVASRKANDPTYSIPIYFPIRPDDPSFDPNVLPAGETFDDVTGFVNRIFGNPTAFRNRGNQINIDTFTTTLSVNYNFNTKADSRIIPYLAAGYGKWIRNFDQPWSGDNSNFLSYGAGMRFFVNEIFSFRADARLVHYMDKNFTIKGALHSFNLPDRQFSGFGGCERDNRDIRPPCDPVPGGTPASFAFPNLGNGGGNADIEVEAELDDFYEIRLGFDVILGGK